MEKMPTGYAADFQGFARSALDQMAVDWGAVVKGVLSSPGKFPVTTARLHWIVIAVVAFSVCGVACRFKRVTAETKDQILSRDAVCVDHEVALFSGSTDDKRTMNRIREFEHEAGRDISEDKAKQLLLQARADYKNGVFKTEDCLQYAEDFETFKKEAAEATNANATSR